MFKPLEHAPWIMNEVIPINDHFQLSCSYSIPGGMWYVGDGPNDMEVAVQVIDKGTMGGEFATLVEFEDIKTNIFSHQRQADLDKLIVRAKQLKYVGRIEVYDTKTGLEKDKEWCIRFLCVGGYDKKQKMSYSKHIWGEGKYRFIEGTIVKNDNPK